jgi:hypothetical protein
VEWLSSRESREIGAHPGRIERRGIVRRKEVARQEKTVSRRYVDAKDRAKQSTISADMKFSSHCAGFGGSFRMTRRAFLSLAGFVALQLSAAAIAQPLVSDSLNGMVPRLPSLALTNGGTFSFGTALDWVGGTTPDFLPALNTPAISRSHGTTARMASTDFSKESPKEVGELKRANFFDYATGEVGFMYGKSTGKYGIESEQGYIIGEVGNEHLHISAGASYENVNGRLPRFVR